MPLHDLQLRDLVNLLVSGSFDFHGRSILNVNISNDSSLELKVGDVVVAKILGTSSSTTTSLWILHNGTLKNVKTFNDGTHDVLYV